MWKYHCVLLLWLLFWWNAQVWINYFCTWCMALLLHNYDKLSPIFSCILLIHNHMIFLMKFGINKQLLIFSKSTILLAFKKIYSCLFTPNICTRNHEITYTFHSLISITIIIYHHYYYLTFTQLHWDKIEWSLHSHWPLLDAYNHQHTSFNNN